MTTETVTAPAATETATAAPAKPAGRPRKISAEALEAAEKLYDSGQTIAQICKQPWCKVGPAALYYHFKGRSPKGDSSVEMRPRGRKGPNAEQLAHLLAEFEKGRTLTDIREDGILCSRVKVKDPVEGEPKTRKHMFSLATLSNAVKAVGKTPRRGRPANPVAVEEVAAEPMAEAPMAAEPVSEVAAEPMAEAPMVDEASAAE